MVIGGEWLVMQTRLQVFAPFHHIVNLNSKGSSSNNQAQMHCMITQWGGGEGGGGQGTLV